MTGGVRATPQIPRARIAAGLAIGNWPSGTGFGMFVVLMLALLPLGVVAIFGTYQSIHTAEVERAAALRLAAAHGADRLLTDINDDRATLRLLANAVEHDARRTALCRTAGVQLNATGAPAVFALFDRTGRRLCSVGHVDAVFLGDGVPSFDQVATLYPRQRQLAVRVPSGGGGVVAVATYGARDLAVKAATSNRSVDHVEMTLTRGTQRLWLVRTGERHPSRAIDEAEAPLNLGGIRFHMAVERPPITALRLAATLLPLFMWFGAAAIGWWVVNRYLIRPLIALNRQVAAYQPGKTLDPARSESPLAREINMLADTFREIADDVIDHETLVSEALDRQRALTREVHHRVKNNLQIIASLINLHSRAATTAEGQSAYVSIQRRVDALSVVHRNHYAAAELTQGIDAQALISELASALRASGPPPGSGFTIKVDCDVLYLTQDVAVPTAFLITELVELVIVSGRMVPVCLALKRQAADGTAELSVTSAALRSSPDLDALLTERFSRVLTGLSRQLRTSLRQDGAEGRYSIMVAARS